MFYNKIKLSMLIFALFGAFCGFCRGEIDKSKYITIDEIKPGMDAYCLTVYQGVEPAKYNLKVVSVIKNVSPNRNAILVMGTDEAFIHTGPVAGCSGSPVYIDGRLAGALSFGWAFSKDPLYGVTPIAEMLSAGTVKGDGDELSSSALDFTKPINLKTAYRNLLNTKTNKQNSGGLSELSCPIATTLPQSSFSDMSKMFESSGFIPVAAGSAGDANKYSNVTMKPGGILALPLVYGDIDLSALGTVTEVADGKIYGFGHSLLGQGAIDVPMATGYVHTVVSNLTKSFKFGQPLEIKGALFNDQATAVVGSIGKEAKMIPTHIRVERYNDIVRNYNCMVASHKHFTPMLAGACLDGATTMIGELPAECTIQYKTTIGIKGYDPVILENFSSSGDVAEFLSDSIGALNIVMNNPYDRPTITSLDFDIKIQPKNMVSHIWDFEVSKTKVKPGETIKAKVTLESFLQSNKTFETEVTIPKGTPAGDYVLTAGGIEDYMQFAARYAPYKFTAENLPGLIKIVNEVGSKKRNSLYVMMALPPSGIAVENSPLPGLPVTKSLLLKNDKRATSVQAGAEWIEKDIPTDTVVLDSKSFMITVEKD